LISVTPISLASGSVKETMGYDSQNRMLWQDQSIYNGTAWIASPSTSRRYIWDGDNNRRGVGWQRPTAPEIHLRSRRAERADDH